MAALLIAVLTISASLANSAAAKERKWLPWGKPAAEDPRSTAVRPPASEVLDPGQLALQNEMNDHAEFWYNLSYVRNTTPEGKNSGSPSLNTSPGLACRETQVSATDNIDEFPAFATVPPNIYLGSILKGNTLLTNTYGVFSGPRNSAKITISAPHTGNPIGTETMTPISQSQYLDALRRILAGGIKVPAATGSQIDRIYSNEQLAFAMKANVTGTNFKVSAQFNVKSVEQSQYALISVNQVFFTVYLDRADYGAEIWAENLSPTDIELISKEMTNDSPPLYVSAMHYGRKAYVLFEASSSSLDIQTVLSAGYKATVEGEIELSAEYKKALESMSAKGFVIGGSATLGNNALSELFGGKNDNGMGALEGIKTWLKAGSEPTPDNPPAALGYEIALLQDGSKVAARTMTSYKEVDCKVGVCPSGFFWGKKNYATWFEINLAPNPRIAPAAGLIDDVIDIPDGNFYTYTWPSCDRIYWRNVSLKCVANERRDFVKGVSPPGVWVWNDEEGKAAHEVGMDYYCNDSNASTPNMNARRINTDEVPIPLDTTQTGPRVEGFAKTPADYWKWRETAPQ